MDFDWGNLISGALGSVPQSSKSDNDNSNNEVASAALAAIPVSSDGNEDGSLDVGGILTNSPIVLVGANILGAGDDEENDNDEQEQAKAEWKNIDGSWYYYDENGVIAVGWKQIDGSWYYFYPEGSMAWSTVVDGYYLGYDGIMVTSEGWEEDEKGSWYYVGANEKVFTGWNTVGSDLYYFYNGGSMAWGQTIDGIDLQNDANDGKAVGGTKVDGYVLNDDGQWVADTTSKDGTIDPSEIQLSQNGIAFIKNYEEGGTKPALKIYDANPPHKDWTIGWGHKVRQGENYDNGITEQQAEELFEKDKERMIETTFRPFLKKYNIQLTQQQFDALVSFTYQNGEYSWNESDTVNARQAIIEFVKNGDYSEISLKKAYKNYMGEKQLPGTIARRSDEMKIFLNGDYTRTE